MRVGEDYYIATSTFEWYPGVCIHHSRDLINWQLVSTPLNRLSQLDMRGNPDSCGVWAPCLSYRDGLFYLVFTDVKRFAGEVKDTHNYFVVAKDVTGPWSDPVYLNSSGFDPSFFHDDDGTTWYVNMVWNHLPATGRNHFLPHKYFGGIVIQQFDHETQTLLGKPEMIYKGSEIGLSEGPHIYKKDGYFYLCVAEGGTGKDHAATFARAKEITGPYETDPQGPLVTSAYAPDTELKRAGHGSMVDTPDGQHYFVHLCGRPLPYRGRCVLGRETAIQAVKWPTVSFPAWPHGTQNPILNPESVYQVESPARPTSQRIDFDGSDLPLDLQSLRFPLPESVANQTERPGFLRLHGRESLGSLFEQALLARRQQAFNFTAETALDFAPESAQHMAGLNLLLQQPKTLLFARYP